VKPPAQVPQEILNELDELRKANQDLKSENDQLKEQRDSNYQLYLLTQKKLNALNKRKPKL